MRHIPPKVMNPKVIATRKEMLNSLVQLLTVLASIKLMMNPGQKGQALRTKAKIARQWKPF